MDNDAAAGKGIIIMTETQEVYKVDPIDTTIYFNVAGVPIPKQSFRYNKNGVAYQTARVVGWQNTVSVEARIVMQGKDPIAEPVNVSIDFYLPNHSRKDLDNLSKAVLDAMNGIVYEDDCQVVELHLHKFFDSPEHGVTVTVKQVEP